MGREGIPDEHTRILSAIAAEVLPRKLRPYKLPDPAALRCMYTLALESAMRMRVLYALGSKPGYTP